MTETKEPAVLEDFMYRGQWCRRYADGWTISMTARNNNTGEYTELEWRLDADYSAEGVKWYLDGCKWVA